jgi:hypothetical protein
MRYRLLIAGVACGALIGGPVYAQNVGTGIKPTGAARGHQTGTRGANFLRIGSSARARALAGAGTALVDGATVLYYNPAGAALVDGFELAVTYTDLYGGSGIWHGYMGAILPLGDAGVVGAQAVVFSSGEIQATTELSPDGFDPIRGDIVEWNAVAVGLTYARRITDRLALGATGKFVQEGIDFANVSFIGFDIGTMFDTGLFGTRLAAAITNIGGESRFEGPAIQGEIRQDLRPFDDKLLGTDLLYRFNTDKMEMPTTFRFALFIPMAGTAESVLGLPSDRHKLNFFSEIDDGFDTDIETRLGLEYSFRDILFLRAGKHFLNEDQAPWKWYHGLSGGLGLRLPFLEDRRIALDYAFTALGILDSVQTFGFQLGL